MFSLIMAFKAFRAKMSEKKRLNPNERKKVYQLIYKKIIQINVKNTFKIAINLKSVRKRFKNLFFICYLTSGTKNEVFRCQ